MTPVATIARELPASRRAREVVDLLTELDALPAGWTGELAFAHPSGEPVGIVFVEHGRVCWAAARGLARRLTDMLASGARIERRALDDCFRRCSEERVPLGEYLVARGIVDAEFLRSALLAHTVESLAAVVDARGIATLRARRGGYAPRFTFSTAELLMGGLRDERARDELSVHFADNGWGAAFTRGDGAVPTLVGLMGEHPAAASVVLRIGQWASTIHDLAVAVQGDAPVVSSRAGQTTFIVVTSSNYLLVGEVPEHGLARILNRRASRAREAVHGGL